MLGHFYVLKNALAFVFWKNPGRHNLFLRFTDLYYNRVKVSAKIVGTFTTPLPLVPTVLVSTTICYYIFEDEMSNFSKMAQHSADCLSGDNTKLTLTT